MSEIKLIDHTNKKWLWLYLETEEEVNEVCEYLLKNNLTIKLDTGGEMLNVYLDEINLSGNGYCFRGDNLIFHVRYFRKLQEVSQTEDFKIWLNKFSKYSIVREYIIEKDQRWIDEKKARSVLGLPLS